MTFYLRFLTLLIVNSLPGARGAREESFALDVIPAVAAAVCCVNGRNMGLICFDSTPLAIALLYRFPHVICPDFEPFLRTQWIQLPLYQSRGIYARKNYCLYRNILPLLLKCEVRGRE